MVGREVSVVGLGGIYLAEDDSMSERIHEVNFDALREWPDGASGAAERENNGGL
jgi:hypothetical protein